MAHSSKQAPADQRRISDGWLKAADLAATFLFAVEGARAAAQAGLDVFGLVVVAFVTALGGGLARDLILGEHPPAALRSPAYFGLAMAGATVVFVASQFVSEVPAWLVVTLDAAGLSLFCVAGADKAMRYGVNPVSAVLLGTLTGCGGGVGRDILLNEIPIVLQTELYAFAAAAGATACVLCLRRNPRRSWPMLVGAIVCFTLRMVSWALDWNLPQVIG
jgi:uncharacterized membrane protein YeiH